MLTFELFNWERLFQIPSSLQDPALLQQYLRILHIYMYCNAVFNLICKLNESCKCSKIVVLANDDINNMIIYDIITYTNRHTCVHI